MAVWLVVAVLGVAALVVAVLARRQRDDVEPAVRQFAEFREAISRQVVGLHDDTAATREHVDGAAGGAPDPADPPPAGNRSTPEGRVGDTHTRG